MGTLLASYTDGSGNQQGALEYFEREGNPDPDRNLGSLRQRFAGFLRARRLVSPSYHLQLSEAMANFALRCARPVVEAFEGRLIYAGGDDVMALTPADTALACARALFDAFQGRTPQASTTHLAAYAPGDAPPHEATDGPQASTTNLAACARGFLLSDSFRESTGKRYPWQERRIPFIVPGPAVSASVGVAIAHFKSPLQDVVRAAQLAEKRAKMRLGRSAVAVTLFKRSGETIEWGVKWDDGGLELYDALSERWRPASSALSFLTAPPSCLSLTSPRLAN